VASELLMVYFQIGHRTTRLALPIIPTQHLLPQCLIQTSLQPQPAAAHAAISMLLRNSCF
jgi:hypothetical protein